MTMMRKKWFAVPVALVLLTAAFALFPACEQPAGSASGRQSGPANPPASPGQLSLIALDCSLAVVWTLVPGADTYTVYYGTGTHAGSAVKWTGNVTVGYDTAAATITGLDNGAPHYVWISASNGAGESSKSEYASAVPAFNHIADSRVFFDYGWMIPGYNETPRSYTVPLGKSLVLSPVHWRIGEDASYTWEVGGGPHTSAGQNSRYFAFTPSGQGTYTVTVTDGAKQHTAQTEVVCTAAEGTYKRSGGVNPKALNAFGFMPGPGQFVNGLPNAGFVPLSTATPASVTAVVQGEVNAAQDGGWLFSLGGYGGYLITGFDHSVTNTGGWELSIKGNAFGGWTEPGVVWVSRDDNGNGQPDDTWYEIKGNKYGDPAVKQQYAVTWIKPEKVTNIPYVTGANASRGIWVDNLGGTGTYPRGYPFMQSETGKDLGYYTLTGTFVSQDTANQGATGYVDVVDPQRYRISDAIQLDGTAANLAYIDFVKVQCAEHEQYTMFGEISTETGVPFDRSLPDPGMLVQGAPAGAGQWNYTFKNNDSGYDLFIQVEGQTISHPRNVGDQTVTLTKAEVYIDYYGGNVAHSNPEPGIITFGAQRNASK